VTNDDLIAAGIWSGEYLEMRARMGEYLLDGSRFGVMELNTKSGSPNDVHLDKRTSEVTAACTLFSNLKMEDVHLRSIDPCGLPLERPDLDATIADGTVIGVEVADLSETRLRKHEAGRNFVETIITDMLGYESRIQEIHGQHIL
jgi:hypothetical protein